jgi:DNA-binding response OmpR family regulator
MPTPVLTESVDDPSRRRAPYADVVPLSDVELAVLDVLSAHAGRVVTRTTLARSTGMRGLGPRRIDAVLVAVRRHVGPERLVNVRNRGWMLLDGRPETASPGWPSPVGPGAEEVPC